MGIRVSRNYTLDVIKLIASFFVVFIHVPFYGNVGECVKVLARFAVPVFFMTSGFFSYESDNKNIFRKIKHIVFILIFTSCLYNFTNIVVEFLSGGTNAVVEYFSMFCDISKWMLLLFFNLPFCATRLWFLFALIYVYFMQMLFNKMKLSYKTIFVISVVGISLHFLIGSVFPNIGVHTEEYMVRNFLLFGYPFYGFGMLFRYKQEKIVKTSDIINIILFVAGCLLSLIPLFYHSVSQISIGTLLLVYVLFCYALKRADKSYPSWLIKMCGCSLGVYIFHRPVGMLLGKIASVLNIPSESVVYGMIFPIVVCVGSFLVSLFFIYLKNIKRKVK